KSFKEIDQQQRRLVAEVSGTDKIFILGMEFLPVITLGHRAAQQSHDLILLSSKDVESEGLTIETTDRGGLATVHSPGQLVIYPMVDLKYRHLGIKNFIDLLFSCTSELLTRQGVVNHYDQEKPGLYTDHGKIAFVGLKVDHGVVRHGISINVSNDLGLFDHILSCGIKCQHHDKIENHQKLNQDDSLNLLFNEWIEIFKMQVS
ncbi:MAG: lipoyl(octanoyl) transferase LipB, partial [Bdellovibrionaceae bacterium]|nr:lipoyl(octanoyl) transferase LipB [Pseudobdellovibrionaceae bacterium]